jgi:hypothetical protein
MPGRPRRAVRSVAAALLALVAVAGSAVAVAPTAGVHAAAGPAPAASRPAPHAADGTAEVDLLDPPAAPWFGPILDWSVDDAAGYAERLGADPAVYAHSFRYPLEATDSADIRRFAEQAARQGALVVITLEPTVPLAELTADDARTLADRLDALREDTGTRALVRFAPDMNGSWTPWGQQAAAFVQAFRTVADAVHGSGSDAAMVWSPAYGAGYPFGAAFGAVDASGTRAIEELDTDGNGRVNLEDDPYRPYYPGDDVVDWVGLNTSHFGLEQDLVDGRPAQEYLGEDVAPDQDFGENVLPEPGKLDRQLRGLYGYPDSGGTGRDFAAEYIEGTGKPAMIETAALYDAARTEGPTELEVKSAWWDQVLSPETEAQHPGIGMVLWREVERPEAEADGAVIDWRATEDPEVAAALRAHLDPATATLGPVTEVRAEEPEPAPGPATGAAAGVAEGPDVPDGAAVGYRDAGIPAAEQMGWIALGAVVLAALFGAAGLAGRIRPAWRYPEEPGGRDRRIDLVLGLGIAAVAVTHVAFAGPYSAVAVDVVGGITGAELFVLVHGLVLGMIQPAAVRRLGGQLPVARRTVRRAGRLYVAALAIALGVFGLSYVPFLRDEVLTTVTLPGADGRVVDLYAGADRLLGYPPPGAAVADLLLLRIGPWVSTILGLLVVLTLLAPVIAWLLQRRLWWALLAVSGGLYVLDAILGPHVLPTQSEGAYPLLAWQVVFVLGMVLGYHRERITRALTGRVGRVAVPVAVVAYVGALALLWVAHATGSAIPGVAGDPLAGLAEAQYRRTELQPGRLLDLALVVVVAYAVLTRAWRPIERAIGWFALPLGRAVLTVFVAHALLVLVVGSLGFLDRSDPWQGAAVHTLVLAALWLLARRRTRERVVPS